MNRTGFVATLSLSALLVVGCGGDSSRIASVTSPPMPVVQPFEVDLDQLEYEVFTGTLQPGQSGGFYDYMSTWGKNCLVSLLVPQESMPESGEPTTFTMSLPTKASYLSHPEIARMLIVRLAPDGMAFLGPIIVQVTWMPWEPFPDSTTTITFRNGTEEVVADVVYLPSINRYRATFEVDHFSDWETDPLPPMKAPELDPLSATYRRNAW